MNSGPEFEEFDRVRSRPLHFFWLVDCSGSMTGEKIGTVNRAIPEVMPELIEAARENPQAEILMRAIQFDDTAKWTHETPTPPSGFLVA